MASTLVLEGSEAIVPNTRAPFRDASPQLPGYFRGKYLRTQRLGRLATVDRSGTPQNSPVGFRVSDDGTVRIGGLQLGASRKFRNVLDHDRVSLVVDDVVSASPWRVRAVEIRGRAEALTDVEPLTAGMSREEIRIHPERIISWGLEGDVP